ncbi:MAG: CZB domain-containing protein [Nitrospirae bacterium]|nr:CZB domain-containing protein [Nitrospirota bacterium]
MTIAKKLYIGSGVVAAVLIVLAVLAYLNIQKTKKNLEAVKSYPEIQSVIGLRTIDHFRWAEALGIGTLLFGKEFTGQIDPTKCKLGEWYYSFKPPKDLEAEYKAIEEPHKRFHATAPKIIAALKEGKHGAAKKIFHEETQPALLQTQEALTAMRMGVKKLIDRDIANTIAAGNRIGNISVIVYAVILGALAAGSIIIIKHIKDSFNTISRWVHAVAAGDTTKNVNIASKDEIADLASDIDAMVIKFKGIITRMKDASNHVASASEELSASSEQMARGANEQAARASQIAASSTEMSQTVIDIAKNASSIEASATETAKAAVDSEKIVDKSIDEVKAIADTVRASAQLMDSLGERSKQIGEIVSVINDIADQTNLLALNAAIEAARAGEQGRGFAVVADEVRKLAERTANATSEIGEMIRAIQNEVGKAVGSMEEGTKRVEAGVEFSVKAGDALRNIVNSVNKLHSMVQQIATATDQMSTVSEQISGDIETISNVSKETSASSEQIAKASSNLARLASNLQNI